MRKAALGILLLGFVLGVDQPASPEARAGVGFAFGFDVSYPQCGHPLPRPGAFAVVGVNGGVPGTRNPCFRRQLAWARRSHSDAPVSLYVNTNNPGFLHKKEWPRSDIDPVTHSTTPNPFGRCAGRNDRACGWRFGWNMAERDAGTRGLGSVEGYVWWLDVETMNTWDGNRQNNRAVLGGMAAYLTGRGAIVGIYSTVGQWSTIAGRISSFSGLYRLPEWIAGAETMESAKTSCSSKRLTKGGSIALAQWFTAGTTVDGDVVCPRSPFHRLPERE
jgi:hypothetical protein